MTHVGLHAGDGVLLHASAYEGYVVETPLEAIPGYVGAVAWESLFEEAR